MTTPFEIADTLVGCLETAFTGDTGAPASICHRPGDQVAFILTQTVDECCAGLGWVRVAQIEPVTDPTQVATRDFNPCNQSGRLVTLELGVARCNPRSDAPTCDEWTDLAARMDLDARAMRRAVCCAATALVTDDSFVSAVIAGAWTPLDSSGGCAGGSMTALVRLDCEEC